MRTLILGVVLVLALGFGLMAATVVPSSTLRRGPFTEGSLPTTTGDFYDRGLTGTLLPAASVLDIGAYDRDPSDNPTSNGLTIRTIVSPNADTDHKWQAAELAVIVEGGNTAQLTRNIVGLIVRAHYRGDAPGSIANIYGQHTIVGPERNSGNAGMVYGHYVQVGSHGSHSGSLGTAYNYYAAGCAKDNAAAHVDTCHGLYIAPQVNGVHNWAIYSDGWTTPVELHGPLYLGLNGQVKLVTEGAADSCGTGARCLSVPN